MDLGPESKASRHLQKAAQLYAQVFGPRQRLDFG